MVEDQRNVALVQGGVLMAVCVCVRVCGWTREKYLQVQIIKALTITGDNQSVATVYSFLFYTYTPSRVHKLPTQLQVQHNPTYYSNAKIPD